jgi:hypothetical protein
MSNLRKQQTTPRIVTSNSLESGASTATWVVNFKSNAMEDRYSLIIAISLRHVCRRDQPDH